MFYHIVTIGLLCLTASAAPRVPPWTAPDHLRGSSESSKAWSQNSPAAPKSQTSSWAATSSTATSWSVNGASSVWTAPAVSQSPGFCDLLGQVPFTFPLANGFPNVQNGSAALNAIQQQAHGTLPNGPLPSTLTDTTALTFQAVAFNELAEVAFFSSLIQNITNFCPGYGIESTGVRNVVLNALLAIQAQEELHALGLNAILQNAGRMPVQPCQYVFPTWDFDDAVEFASISTDVAVLGGLQDVLNTVAVDGDTSLIPLLASILGQEGEQNGFFRNLEGNTPSALPFLTASTGTFAFSFINQVFIVPGTCPNLPNVPIFGKLNVQSPFQLPRFQGLQQQFAVVQPTNQQLTFSFMKNGTTMPTNIDDLSLVYINQQNLPIVQSLNDVQVEGETVTFTANFPFSQFLLNGLTIAAVTNSPGPFANASAVANATLFGPGVIEVQ